MSNLGQEMDRQFTYSKFQAIVSLPRIQPYIRVTGDKHKAIGLYAWNKTVASAFMPLLQAAEISLRNAIQTPAQAKFNNPMWVRPLVAHLNTPKSQDKYKYLLGEIDKAESKLRRQNKRISIDGIIANLTFGFWVELLTNRFNDPRNNQMLWPALIGDVFPNAKHKNLKIFHQHYNEIRDLRNRISHHETVWPKSVGDQYDDILRHLNRLIDIVEECIEYHSQEYSCLLKANGFDSILRGLCTNASLQSYVMSFDSNALIKCSL